MRLIDLPNNRIIKLLFFDPSGGRHVQNNYNDLSCHDIASFRAIGISIRRSRTIADANG
jgi:hypothetical protein